MKGRIDFRAVREAASRSVELIADQYLPGGRWVGDEYIVKNPTRNDRRPGSFKVNRKGMWGDFATGEKGDMIDLVSYILGRSKVEAARELAELLNIDLAPKDRERSTHRTSASIAASPGEARTAPRSFPSRTKPDAEGKPRFIEAGDEGPRPRRDERRRHSYRQGGVPVKIKIMTPDGKKSAYRVVSDGKVGWQYRRPDGFKAVPFFVGDSPFDTSGSTYWPQDEKDVETLAQAELAAFTFGGTGDGLPTGCEEYVRGRDVVILAYSDEEGRKHAEKKAKLAAKVANSVRVVHFPEFSEKGDVSDWPQQHSVEKLLDRVAATEPWVPEVDAAEATCAPGDNDERPADSRHANGNGSTEENPPQIAKGVEPPKHPREIRRHVYRTREGVRKKVKIMVLNPDGKKGAQQWYHIGGEGSETLWQNRKPDNFAVLPYFTGEWPFDAKTLFWPEGEKDVETLALHSTTKAFTYGGTGEKYDGVKNYVVGKEVIILADNDDEGRKHAEAKAAHIHGVAAAVWVVHFRDLAEKEDVSDFFKRGGTFQQLKERVEATPLWKPPQQQEQPKATARERIPLTPPDLPVPEFPVDALGAILGPAAKAIANKVQVPVTIAAQSVLAATSLATQGRRDVMMPFGQKRPLSVFVMTIAESGDRKTSADTEALRPIKKFEKKLQEEYEQEMTSWRIAHACWAAEKKTIEGRRKNFDYAARKKALEELGEEPQQPIYPFLTAPDPTIEGLAKAWVNARPSLGLFSAEGGTFFGGHGMSADHKLKTSAALSGLWDGEGIRRLRAGDGVTLLSGRRLAAHLMVQPEAADAFLNDEVIKGQGFHSRFLIGAPPSLAGQRLFKPIREEDESAIRAYEARLLEILERTLPLKEGTRNELDPPVMTLTTEATKEWRDFCDHVEVQVGPGGSLADVKAFAAKAAEHAVRIAGVLTLVENPDANEIGVEEIGRGIEIAEFYLAESLRLARISAIAPHIRTAQRLYEWLLAQGNKGARFKNIIQSGPNRTRSKARAEAAMKTLLDHGYVEKVSARPRTFRAIPEELS